MSESLERRRLLNAAVVIGTTGSDSIVISQNAGVLVVTMNGVPQSFAGATSLEIDAREGHDTIVIENASFLPLTINGAAGNDVIRIGTGRLADAALSTVSIVGGTGADRVELNDTLSTSGAEVRIDNPFDTFVEIDSLTLGAMVWLDAGTDASAIEAMVYDGSAGADVITLLGTHSRIASTLRGNAGADQVTIESDIDTSLRGPVTIDGGSGVDHLVVDDSADSFADTYFLAGSSAIGTLRKDSGGAIITYTSVSSLTLYAGDAGFFPSNQHFRATHIPAETAASIFAGGGDDVLYIGDGVMNLDAFDASITFFGQEDRDRIEYLDAIGNDTTSYIVRADSFRASDGGPVGYSDVEDILIRGNNGPNVFTVLATDGITNVTLDGGGGDDQFFVGAGDIDATVANSVSIVGGGGNDTLYIDDTADEPGNDVYTISAGLLLKSLKAVLWSSAIENLTEAVFLYASANADEIHVNSTSPLVALTIDAGDGDDAIFVNSTTDGSSAAVPITVRTGNGADRVIVNADFANADAIVRLDAPADELAELTIRAGGRLVLGGDASQVVLARQASIEGVLDVGAGTLILNGYASMLTTLHRLTRTGYAGGSWTGSGTGAQILSGYAATHGGAIAILHAGEVRMPSYGPFQTIATDAVLRYTLAGDANGDRVVGFDDLLAIAQHYGSAGGSWGKGDFTYDGVVGFDDLLALAQSYGRSLPAVRADRAPQNATARPRGAMR